MTRSRMLWSFSSCVFLTAVVYGWGLLADARVISPVFLPSPGRTATSLYNGLVTGNLIEKLLGTTERMLYGWMLASIVGILLGAVVGVSRQAQAYLGASLEALRPLPASATIPVFIALFGLNQAMVLAVVAFGALWPLLLATLHGFKKVEPRLYEVASVLRMPRLAFVWKIALPSAMPDILAGARISLTASLALAVAGEMLTGIDGLGQSILNAGRLYRSADVFAGMLLMACVGLLSVTLLGALESRLLRWKRLQN